MAEGGGDLLEGVAGLAHVEHGLVSGGVDGRVPGGGGVEAPGRGGHAILCRAAEADPVVAIAGTGEIDEVSDGLSDPVGKSIDVEGARWSVGSAVGVLGVLDDEGGSVVEVAQSGGSPFNGSKAGVGTDGEKTDGGGVGVGCLVGVGGEVINDGSELVGWQGSLALGAGSDVSVAGVGCAG